MSSGRGAAFIRAAPCAVYKGRPPRLSRAVSHPSISHSRAVHAHASPSRNRSVQRRRRTGPTLHPHTTHIVPMAPKATKAAAPKKAAGASSHGSYIGESTTQPPRRRVAAMRESSPCVQRAMLTVLPRYGQGCHPRGESATSGALPLAAARSRSCALRPQQPGSRNHHNPGSPRESC